MQSGKGATADSLAQSLSSQKDTAQLKDSCRPGNCQITKIDLVNCFEDHWFVYAGEYSSKTGDLAIESAELDDGKLKLVVVNKSSNRTGTVWIDTVNRKVTKAMENEKVTFTDAN